MSTRMLICRRGMGRLGDTCERCDARTALGQQHQHGFGQCPPPLLLPPFKINFFIRCSSTKTLFNCVLSPDTQGTKSGTFLFWHFATGNRVPAARIWKPVWVGSKRRFRLDNFVYYSDHWIIELFLHCPLPKSVKFSTIRFEDSDSNPSTRLKRQNLTFQILSSNFKSHY